MLLEPALNVLLQIVLAGNCSLVVEYIGAKLVGQLRAHLVLQVARVDCSLEGPVYDSGWGSHGA